MPLSPLQKIQKAIQLLSKGNEQAAAKASQRVNSIPADVPLDLIHPRAVARSALLQPTPTPGWSESPIFNRAPRGAALTTPEEFLSRTPELSSAQDEAIVQALIESIQKNKLKSLPLTWADEYTLPDGRSLVQAQMDARHRMTALQRLGINDPILMNLYSGSKFNLEPSRWQPDTLDRVFVDNAPLSVIRRRMLNPKANILKPKPGEEFQLSPLWMDE